VQERFEGVIRSRKGKKTDYTVAKGKKEKNDKQRFK
jgi:hypothetical protein